MTHPIRRRFLSLGLFLWGWAVLGLFTAPALAADTAFEQLLIQREVTAIHELEGKVFTGLDGGGVLVRNTDDLAVTDNWTAGDQIAGNDVSAFAWTGRHLWIATLGSGLTRVADPVGSPSFRQYTSNLGGLDVTSVDGSIIGDSERVFYGTAGQGIGLITDGLSSSVYTAEQDGLISNVIHDVHFLGTEVFVATPLGISRFANNVFTDQNTGLPDTEVFDLDLDADGNLVAAGRGGVSRWDPDTETWTRIGNTISSVHRISTDADLIYALALPNLLLAWDGSRWSDLDAPQVWTAALHAAEDLWIGGSVTQSTSGGRLEHAHLSRQLVDGNFERTLDYSSQVFSSFGVTFGLDGSQWMGDFNGSVISHRTGDDWSHIYEVPTAANDTLTLFPGRGNVLTMATSPDGSVWAGQFFGGGLLAYRPTTNTTDLMSPANSGLNGRNVIRVVPHPDGPVIVLHDGGSPEMVDVLVDPENWGDAGSWMTVTRDDGLGAGTSAWDALVVRPDVIWFAVGSVGLVRWDVNGLEAGPDDPLTWFDRTDDHWSPPVTDFDDTTLDPVDANSLAPGSGETIWVGGNGLVNLFYDAEVDTQEVIHAIQEKRSSSDVGLVNGNVQDIAVAGSEVWVATYSGLNRVRTKCGDYDVTTWIDVRNYLANPDYSTLYSPSVIAPLPGLIYQRITADPTGKYLLLSSDQGVTLITPGTEGSGCGEESSDPLAGVYCFPNPWSPGDSGVNLSVAGLPTEAGESDPVRVDIYNLEGQPVRGGNFTAGESVWSFWDGRNRLGEYVVSGLYVLKVSWRDYNAVRTVALVR